jgi:uncharacterized protein (DUF1015 family)
MPTPQQEIKVQVPGGGDDIGCDLSALLASQVMEVDSSPCIYVYQVVHRGRTQVGLWTLTNIRDYTDGKIKKHELTLAARENLLADYLLKTGIDANPVLLTYKPIEVVDEIIRTYLLTVPTIDLQTVDATRHRVWRISTADDLGVLCGIFKDMDSVYIADGHHRLASMAKMALERRRQNSINHSGEEDYNYFTSVYMNTAELQVLEYNRLLRDLGPLSPDDFLKVLSAAFELTAISYPFKPAAHHEIGMYLVGKWYRLLPLPGSVNYLDPVEQLGVSILQHQILRPVLNITDARTDPRLSFESGLTSIEELEAYVDSGKFQAAFVLHPISIYELMKVADANRILPPKSTWVEPKFPVGLLTSYLN